MAARGAARGKKTADTPYDGCRWLSNPAPAALVYRPVDVGRPGIGAGTAVDRRRDQRAAQAGRIDHGQRNQGATAESEERRQNRRRQDSYGKIRCGAVWRTGETYSAGCRQQDDGERSQVTEHKPPCRRQPGATQVLNPSCCETIGGTSGGNIRKAICRTFYQIEHEQESG